MYKFISTGFLLIMAQMTLISQSSIPIGTWQSHLSYKEGRRITQSRDHIIYSSEKGIFLISKDDNSVEFLSKEDGLSDVQVSALYFDSYNEQLIIVYTNNNLDIISSDNDDVINIPFIESNTNILGSKNVNDFFIANEKDAYFATDFGILGFNLQELEFPFTTFTPSKINAIAETGGKIYAGTDDGLFVVEKNGTNLSDFNIWKLIPESKGLPSSVSIKGLAVKFNRLFVLAENVLYKAEDDGSFSMVYSPSASGENINYISEEGSELMIGVEKNNASKTIFVGETNGLSERGYGCVSRAVYSLEDQKGNIWYADQWDPVKYTQGKTGECKKLTFPVPFTNEASNVRFKKNKAYLASNGITEDFQYKFTRYGFYTLEDNIWTNFNQDNIPTIKNTDFLNLYAIAPHPTSAEVYLGSYYNGIISYNEETKEAKHWNKDNSVLQAVVGDDARTRIAGLTFDKDENLWISNFGAPKPLVVKTKENTWHSFSVPGSTSLADIVIDQEGNKWIAVVGAGNGLIVYHEGAKIGDPSDDKIRYITRNNSEITGNKVNSLLVDLDGSVWVGTDMGPVVFDCGDPFNESCRGNTRKVVVEGIPALLLRDEDILCIEADGGNRKWFGTRNGIFVQSPDGITQQAKFDDKNSPLLNNKILDLGYNKISGEMMIISSAGIQSYKTSTTGGGNSFSSNVYAYPNPVRPDYSGPIAIKGLVRDANIKITDINGRLVYETKALGGQATWDGNDYNGIRAAAGVYLVFSANENTSTSSEALVTKIMIVR
ncbi:MAG: hypothetical protein IPN89_08585 [Saprospiraceae bacterium]|nr:hypothetical protein [Saprospiraceae bacterium]